MRKTFAAAGRDAASLSMTPMIDVVFLLLTFFVCTANFQPLEFLLPGQLPPPAEGASSVPLELATEMLERIVVSVDGDADRIVLRVNDRPCSGLVQLRELLTALAAIDAELPVVIDPAPTAPLGFAIDACDVSRLAGFANVQFAANIQ